MSEQNPLGTGPFVYVGTEQTQRQCVTHHACDCILAERDRLREQLHLANVDQLATEADLNSLREACAKYPKMLDDALAQRDRLREHAEKLANTLRWLAEDSQKYKGTDACHIARRALAEYRKEFPKADA